MYCKKCGKEIQDDSNFCNHCGARQTPKKIVVEFNEPSLPSINGDFVRRAIFGFGRFLKKIILFLKPIVLRLLVVGLVICIVSGAAYGIAYYSYYLINKPPKASTSEVSLYREKGIYTELRKGFTIGGRKTDDYYEYEYINPSEILPNCKWHLDEDMMNTNSYYRFFDGDSTDINDTREEYLMDKSEDFAYPYSMIALGICLFYYLVRLFIKFRRWLYKNKAS